MSTTVASTSINAAAPPPPEKKTSRVVALAAIAGLLGAVAIYLVAFPPKKIDNNPVQVASNDDPNQGKQNPPVTPVVPVTPNPVTPNPVTPPMPVGPEESLTWPTLAASDFALKTEIVATAPKDDNGVIQLTNGTELKLKLTADKDCSAYVFWIDPQGSIMQLFPNRHDRDGRLVANQERLIPGGKGYELITIPTEGNGPEYLRVVATTGSMPALPTGDKDDKGYTSFSTKAEKEQVVSTVRGIQVRQKSTGRPEDVPMVAEAEIKFRVNP
jgi:hypothetical protein